MELSFIIPTYNRQTLLRRAINSIVISDIPRDDYEIIVIDDGSDCDNSVVIDEFKDIVNITYHKYEKNTKSESLMRNTGLKKAIGKYIRFLDDDDIFNSLGLFKEYEYLKVNNYNIILVNMVMFTPYIQKYAVSMKRYTRGYTEGIANYYVKLDYLKSNNIFFEENLFKQSAEDQYFNLIMLALNPEPYNVFETRYLSYHVHRYNKRDNIYTDVSRDNFGKQYLLTMLNTITQRIKKSHNNIFKTNPKFAKELVDMYVEQTAIKYTKIF